MPESNLQRVAAWLAEEEEKKRRSQQLPAGSTRLMSMDSALPGQAQYFRSDVDESGTTRGREGFIPEDFMSSLSGSGYRVTDAAGMQAARGAFGAGEPPPGKLPFISGVPVHGGKVPPLASMPNVADLAMAKAMSGAANLARPGVRGAIPAPAPVAKKDPRAVLKRARREVEVRSTTEGIQPQLREPMDPLAARSATQLPTRVSSFLKRRREPSGLEAAQGRANLNQLVADTMTAGEYLGAGIAGVRPRPEAYERFHQRAGQPVEQYQQQANEQRQQEQDELALADAQREAERAAAEMTFKQGRATSEDQLARDRMAQEKALSEARLRGDAADRGLRREEMVFRQKEGAELKQQLADQRRMERQAREDELDIQRLGAATTKAPFGEFQTALEDIDRLIPGIAYGQTPSEAPLGVRDRFGRALAPVGGEFLMSDEGKSYATAIANLRDLVARMRSGAVLNTGEEKHYLALLGDRALSDPRSAADGINAVRQGIAQKLRNAQGGFPNVLDRYESTGATTYRAPIFGTAPARPTQRTITRPDGSVWMELDNGEAEMIAPPTRSR